MEMEQINDNTIRVLIDNDDLEERGITVLDLLSNQNQIEAFFYSILEEVDIDESFKENDMITFQVVPSKSGLELYISKDNSIDPKLFNHNYKENQSSEQKYRAPKFTNSSDFMDVDNNYDDMYADDNQVESVFKFDDFEELITFSNNVYLKDGISFLHVIDSTYYVSIVQFTDQIDKLQIEMEKGMALEFGELSKLSFDYLQEHGDELMQGDALQKIKGYFN